ncbi:MULTISPECIES: E22 family MetX-like putative esterase [unclassified Alteromonas]|uniref:E22 family MetX-like putative esterase n=1 Tax=unclassified Alteromonas TaxID=2614992 RepID=UPI0009E05ACC|nr:MULTISPECIES: homoserine O-acetyltransferase [unclassified Alteromonas]
MNQRFHDFLVLANTCTARQPSLFRPAKTGILFGGRSGGSQGTGVQVALPTKLATKLTIRSIAALFLLSALATTAVLANDEVSIDEQQQPTLLVNKHTFHMDKFTTFGGKTINDVKIGWEAYGKLNAQKDNVILITHYFSGTSHAAGKYSALDENAGYWDSIIGPDKAIDTNRFFVISADTLVNLNAYDEKVVTTGPATINPSTGKPYGLDFPVVTIRDFVNVQKALLESLGIKKLHAVVGPSMGAMQAIDWASAYPSWVPRMLSVIGAGESDAWTTTALEHWATPIRLDKKWNKGNYSPKEAPTDGLTASLMLITQNALTPEFFNAQGNMLGFKNVEQAPLSSINEQHSITKWLKARAAARGKKMDANHLLYLVRACQLFVAGHKENLDAGLDTIKAKTLFLPADSDLLLMPYLAQHAHQTLKQQGNNSEYTELQGSLGHLEGVANISKQATAIRQFLENE